MDLGYPGLADIHHLGDLLHAEIFPVVQRHHRLLVLPQGGDALRQRVQQLLAQEGVLGTPGAHAVGHVHAPLVLVVEKGVQAQKVAQRRVGQVLLVLLAGYPQPSGDLLIGGAPAQLGVQLHAGLVDLPGLAPHTAGHPVLAAGQVDDRPADALGDEGLEFDALVGVELIHGPHQGQDALVDDVVHLREAGVDTPHLQGDGLHQPHVAQRQGPLQLLTAGAPVKQEEVLLAHCVQLLLGIARLGRHGRGRLAAAHTAAAFLSFRARVMLPRDWICTSLVISLKASTYRLG